MQALLLKPDSNLHVHRLLFVVVMLCMVQYTQAMEAHMPKDWYKLPDMGKWDGVPSADFRTGRTMSPRQQLTWTESGETQRSKGR